MRDGVDGRRERRGVEGGDKWEQVAMAGGETAGASANVKSFYIFIVVCGFQCIPFFSGGHWTRSVVGEAGNGGASEHVGFGGSRLVARKSLLAIFTVVVA